MAQDDLGIVYKDESQPSSTSDSKKTPSDYSDLGISFKDEQDTSAPSQDTFLDKALDFLVPGASDFSKHPEHILGAAKTLAESVPAAAAQSVGNLASTAMPFSPQSNILNQGAEAVPTPSPQTTNALSAAANVVPGIKSLEGIGQIGKLGLPAAKDALKKIMGTKADEMATNFMRNLIGDQPSIKAEFKNRYNAISDTADKYGYNLLPNTTQKPIQSKGFNAAFANLNSNDRQFLLNSLNGNEQLTYNSFLDKPTYNNAHNLQSMLGSQGISLLKNRETAKTGGNILGLRDALNNDIQNTFNKYGDTDLANEIQNVRSDYGQNEKKLLLANQLNSSLKDMPDEGLTADAQKLINRYGRVNLTKVGKYAPKLKTPESDAAITQIKNTLSNQKSVQNILSKLKRPAQILGGGLLAGAGFYKGKELLEGGEL